jgi:hypothetical protein
VKIIKNKRLLDSHFRGNDERVYNSCKIFPEPFVKGKSRYRKINFSTTSALSFIAIVLMINVILPNIILSQGEHDSEGWIQGHVTYIGKDSVSVEEIRYQFDPLLIIKDPEGNILEPVALKNAEIVKVVLDKNGRAMKIVIIQLRK